MTGCTDCGACCVDQTITLNVLERNTLPAERVDEKGHMRMVDGHCIMLDPVTRTCTDYENRPTICRDFKEGCGRCVIMRTFSDLHLGGMGPGPLRTPVRPGQFNAFAAGLHITTDYSGNVTHLDHAEATYPIECALKTANAQLPSKGF